jgi:hypothetical protein
MISSQMTVRLSALSASRSLPPERFLVLISVRGWVDPRAIVQLEGIGQLKYFSDLIRNRTHDLPACSIVPQSTMLPRAFIKVFRLNVNDNTSSCSKMNSHDDSCWYTMHDCGRLKETSAELGEHHGDVLSDTADAEFDNNSKISTEVSTIKSRCIK